MKLIHKFAPYLFVLIGFSCAVPKETITRLQRADRKQIDLPVEYASLFPDKSFAQWDKDYSIFHRNITKDVIRTQMGLSYERNGVKTWMVTNSAKPHVVLDSSTRIIDKSQILGEWRAIVNRRIRFIDSASYDSKTIYRNAEVLYDEKKADVFLIINPERFKLIGTESGKDKYRKVIDKNYQIDNGRYLLLFGPSKAAASVAMIGRESENLILNTYTIIEDKVDGKYISYKTILTQLVFQKANP